MYWSDTDTEGITNNPSGADKVEQKFAPVDEQMEDENSIYNYYKKAVRIRNTYPENCKRNHSCSIRYYTGKYFCHDKNHGMTRPLELFIILPLRRRQCL